MSSEINEGRAVTVVDVAPSNETPPVITATTGRRRGIPVLIAPLLPSQRDDRRARAGTGQETCMGFQGFLLLEEADDDRQEAHRRKWTNEVMRAWMTVLATIAASVTFQAGLSPPGGFWQADDDQGHRAGDPVLRDQHWWRYQVFSFMNATAFVTSLTIIVFLASERYYHTVAKLLVLFLILFVDLISLVGAYIAGSTGYVSAVYVIVITVISFLSVIYIGKFTDEISKFLWSRMPCMLRLVQSTWFPVPAEVVRYLPREERRTERRNQRGGCSACCASAPRAEG
ncbi:unnamed protein product [Urochloa decumbens]|uniref:PGG domain-containing protein n=1 Tax=Urochloa decumbens TaxID=240449 RepID=A0ABC9DSJ5_9POAL